MLLCPLHPLLCRFSFARLQRLPVLRTPILLLISLSISGYITSTWAGQLVIVIDDVGYRAADHQVMRLPLPVTVAVLPTAPHAANMAKQAAQQGRETIIHLPMQPLGHQKVEAGALHTGMGASEVQRTLQQAMRVVPNAIGLNNHMGSAATSDPALMKLLMQQLKAQQLLFLDSRTISTSVAESTAHQLGVPALRRTVFLDDDNSLTQVQAEFQRAVNMAQHKGWAIAIGHPRPNTIKVLQAGLSRLPRGVQLVSLSTLVHAKSHTSSILPTQKPHSEQPVGKGTSSQIVVDHTATRPHATETSRGLYQPGPIIEPSAEPSHSEISPAHTASAKKHPQYPVAQDHPLPGSALLPNGAESLTTPPEPVIIFEVLGMSESPDSNPNNILPTHISTPSLLHRQHKK
ncbi:MAG: divergent polysaccharide deacetylase family protein [Plesiomonas sp.]|uniref:divergent polysaccharide deacetylase family protein n=1 Tax=Plesiomonas sp. TaxID=2486279 RepID=UPI003F3975D3